MALIPNIVDQLAQNEPYRLYAECPISAVSYEDGYRKISYSDFANAINGMAWWLYNTLGPRSDIEVLAYIGPNDLRYPALVLSAVKAGFVVGACVALHRMSQAYIFRCFSHHLAIALMPKSIFSIS